MEGAAVEESVAAALGVGSGCSVDGDGQRRASEVRVWGVVHGDGWQRGWVEAWMGDAGAMAG